MKGTPGQVIKCVAKPSDGTEGSSKSLEYKLFNFCVLVLSQLPPSRPFLAASVASRCASCTPHRCYRSLSDRYCASSEPKPVRDLS